MAGLKQSALGNNPLGKGIFSKTETKEETLINKQESRINIKETRFLQDCEKEKLNLRIPIVINDWLDNLLKQGKRKHGQKISKEIWLQAALELMMAMPVQWEEIQTEEDLESTLLSLESRVKNQESSST